MPVDVTALAVFAVSMVATPGPANMVLLSAGARFGLAPALPFVAGVALGKQAVIWPVGFGLLGLAGQVPLLFATLKWACAAYIVWLAWRIASGAIRPAEATDAPPGFRAGLIVHPLNPKAWAMVATGFTGFVAAGSPALPSTLAVGATFLAVQACLHPLWCWGGARLAARLAGRPGERWLMIGLGIATLLSVAFVLLKGA